MLILFLLFLVFSPILSTADEKLIKVQCHNAEVPALCIQCVTSDPRGLQADKFGIAAILLNCMQTHAKNITDQMWTLASSSEGKNMTFVANNCAKDYISAEEALGKAKKELKGGDYDQTNALILEGLKNQEACNDVRVGYNLTFPIETVYEMRVYDGLTDAALRIIDRFWVLAERMAGGLPAD